VLLRRRAIVAPAGVPPAPSVGATDAELAELEQAIADVDGK
jgi:hypothetical protein